MSSSPTVLAAGQLAPLGRGDRAVAAAAPDGLLDALAQVPDPRDPRGIRYALAPVLAIVVCAMLAGARSYAAIAEWAADAPPRLRARLGLPGAVPDLATLWRVLTAVDPAAFEAAVGAWVRSQLAARRRPGRRPVMDWPGPAQPPEDREAQAARPHRPAEYRTAQKYSNVIDCERLRQAATNLVTCPSDLERPRRREFASRGSVS